MLAAERDLPAAPVLGAPLVRPRASLHWLAPPVLFALAYFASAEIGFAFRSPTTPQSLLWLPNSVMLAVLLVVAPASWPLFLAAAFPAQLIVAIHTHSPVLPMALLYTTNCLDAMLGAALTTRITRGRFAFRDLRSMLVFMLCAAMLSPILLSFADAAITTASGWGASYFNAFETRVRSNTLTHLLVVPGLVSAFRMSRAQWKKIPAMHYVNGVGLLTAVAASTFMMLNPAREAPVLPFASATLPVLISLLLVIALQFGPGTTSLGLLFVAVVASWELMHGALPLAGLAPQEGVAALQFMLMGLAIPFLCLATVHRERLRDSNALRSGFARIRSLTFRSLAATPRPRRETPSAGVPRVQQRDVEAEGELAVTLSHELRQPLTAIRSNAQAGLRLLAGQSPPLHELRSILQDIVADDTLAAGVIDRTSAMLRNGAAAFQSVDVNDVCARAWRAFSAEPATAGVSLNLSLQQGLPRVSGDFIQLQQVVTNLLRNALEASLAQTHTLPSVTLATTVSGKSIHISLSDNGSGFVSGVPPLLFQPFYSTKEDGIGVGLAIVRSIVDLHHGTVIAENNPGGGATFTVMLPIRDPASD